MPSLSPLTAGTETLTQLAEGSRLLTGLEEGAQALASLAERAYTVVGGTWPSLATFPSAAASFPSIQTITDGPVLAAQAEGGLTLTPLQES